MIHIAVITLIVVALWIFLDVVLRYAFNSPLTGTYELVEEYMMPIMVFFSVSVAWKRGKHVNVDVIYQALSSSIRKWVDYFIRVVCLVFFVVLLYANLYQCYYAFTTGSASRSALEYPMWPAYLILSIGILVLCLRLILGPDRTVAIEPYGRLGHKESGGESRISGLHDVGLDRGR